MRGILSGAVRLLASIVFCQAVHANVFVVNVGGSAGLAFMPKFLSIAPGDTVVFVNKGGFHNVKADDNSFRCARGCDGQPGGSGAPSSSIWVASVTFPSAANIGYYCEIHGQPGKGMYGTINVLAPQPPPSLSGTPAIGTAFATLLALALTAFAGWRLRRRV